MTKGYVIITEDIHDEGGMAAYGRAAAATLAEFGARVLVAGRDSMVLEGSWHGQQTVIMEFDSTERARAWYESAGYTTAKALRQAAAECRAILISGFEPPSARPPEP